MKINKVVVMYLDTGEIVRPSTPPDVSAVKGIFSSRENADAQAASTDGRATLYANGQAHM
jgi:hypothetical protein